MVKAEKTPRRIWGRFNSIRSAMMTSFSILIVATLLVFLIIALTYTRNAVFDNAIMYSEKITNQVNSDIDSYINYMENISSVIASSSDVQKYFYSETQNEKEETEQKERIQAQFKTILDSRSDIVNIAAVSENGRNIVNLGEEGINPFIDLAQLNWFRSAMEATGGIAISSSHVQNAIESSYQWVITLSRTLISSKTEQPEGLFFIDLNYTSIKDLCTNNQIGEKGYIYILDDKGNFIYHPQQQLLYGGLKSEYVEEILSCPSQYLIFDEGSDSMLYTLSKSEKTGWTVVGVAYASELLRTAGQTQILYLLVAVVLLICVVVVSNTIAKGITKPIEVLKDSMALVERGEFAKAEIEVTANNELGSLNNSFNLMTERIEKLMEQNIFEQQQKRKSELLALQSQINPHFLYNTLDSIIWMAEAKKSEEVVMMTSALATLFRQSISNEAEQVPISVEVEYVKSYLIIQKMRYKDKLDYDIIMNPEIGSMSIIKLILQPIVENAIYHGIKYKEKKGKLTIKGDCDDRNIIFTISDDGIGMDQETLSHIFDQRASHKTNPVGVLNVQKRLQLYYGNNYGISFVSQEGKGTTATITIPKQGGAGNEKKYKF